MKKFDLSFYLVTDEDLVKSGSLEEVCEKALQSGVTFLQVREKETSSKGFYEKALRIKKIADQHKVPMVINDRLDIALAVEAEGVHLGQSDLPIKVARKLLGPEKIIGASVKTVDFAKKAEKDGADYLGVGAFFKTATKTDTSLVSLDLIQEITQAVSIPLVVIGGIKEERLSYFEGRNIDGFAVVSDIMGAEDVAKKTRSFKKEVERVLGGEK